MGDSPVARMTRSRKGKQRWFLFSSWRQVHHDSMNIILAALIQRKLITVGDCRPNTRYDFDTCVTVLISFLFDSLLGQDVVDPFL